MNYLQSERAYWKLFLAGVVNGIGDRFSQVAVLALLLQLTGSGMAVGIILAIKLLPALVISPFAGLLADRYSRKRILIWTDIMRIPVALSFLLVNGEEDVWLFYAGTLFLAIGEAIYQPVRKAMVASAVKKENLLKVNMLEQVMVGVVLVIGSLSGGIVAYFLGEKMTFAVNGISFLIAGILVSRIVLERGKELMDRQGGLRHFQAGFQLIARSSALKLILLLQLTLSFGDAIFNVLISVYAVEEYGRGEFGIGVFYASLGIGLVLTMLTSEKLHRKLLLIGTIAIMMEGLFQIMISQLPHFWVAVSLFIFVSFVTGIGNACFDAILMQETPEQKQGIIFGLFHTFSSTLFGLFMLGAGWLLYWFPPQLLGAIGGGSLLLIGIITLIIVPKVNRV